MKSFQITIDIYATRIDNPFDMKVTRNIDVDDDRKLDEIIDIPIGKLILGSAYAPHVSDIMDMSKYNDLPSTNKPQLEIVLDGMSDEQKKVIDHVLNNLSEITNPKSKLENTKEQNTPTELATKDSIENEIYSNLNDFQKMVYASIYVSIYCTLAESKYVGSALELDRHFMELVATDKDGERVHVYFRLDNMHKDLPRFDIEFVRSDVYVRIHEGDFIKTCVLLNRETDHAKVYTQNIKYMRETYKTIVSHVVSKIVLLEGLS